MAAATVEVTALDVARELVATKLALFEAIENLTGTSPAISDDPDEALARWVYGSPLGMIAWDEALGERTGAIASEMLTATGEYLLRNAR